MRPHQVLAFLLLFVIASGASENASTSRGCGLDLLPQYVSLCDLDTIWGIVVEAVAGAGALITLLLMLILLVRLPFIKDKEKKDPVGLHFLFLLGTLGLFGLTFAFIIREDETICSVRRFLWGVLFALCFSCLLSQAWRVRRLVRHGKSPSSWQLVGMALCLMLVQVIIAIEWLVLTVLRDAKPACAYEPMDFAMALIYDMVLLVATLGLALFTLCGKFKKWKQNGACLLVTAFLSLLIWVAWMTMYLFGNAELRQGDAWGDPTLAITLVASGWVFVIFHAIPEIHCTILPAPQENTPNYFDTSQPRMRETAFEEDVQLPRTYMENKAFSMDEHNAGKVGAAPPAEAAPPQRLSPPSRGARGPGDRPDRSEPTTIAPCAETGLDTHSFFIFIFCLLGPHPQHMEVPRLEVQSELPLPAYTTATVTPDPSRICNLHHSSRQHQIPQPTERGWGRTHVLMAPSRIHFCCATMGTPR